jgi:hypothetical protein
MATKSQQTKNQFPSRRSSLLHHKETSKKTRTPEFLQAVKPIPEDDAITEKNFTPHSTPNKGYVFTMSKPTTIALMFAMVLGTILLFVSGYLTAYILYKPAESPKIATSPLKPQKLKLSDTDKISMEKAAAFKQSVSHNLKIIEGDLANKGTIERTKNRLKSQGRQKIDALHEQQQLQKKDLVSSLVNSVSGGLEVISEGASTQKESFTAKPIKDAPYRIQFGKTETRSAAEGMVVELRQQGLSSDITETTDDNERDIFLVRSGHFGSYYQAAGVLKTMPNPYALWGKVISDNENSQK